MITTHTIVKNEPFLYYVIYAAYPFVDKMLLCDTGTDDPFCAKQLARVINDDKDHKIEFTTKKIQSKLGHQWSSYDANIRGLFDPNATGVETIRQEQIDATTTDFFLVLDGDEIHTSTSMQAIKNASENWDSKNACGFIYNMFMNSLDTMFMTQPYGRLFLTRNTVMDGGIFPSEMHITKSTRSHMAIGINSTMIQDSLCYHYEKYLKPIRRDDGGVRYKVDFLPEVIQKHMYIYENYEKYKEGKELI